MRAFTLAAALAVCLAGSALSESGTPALHGVAAKTPAVDLPHYHTLGTYPQVAGSNIDLRKVNAGLRRAAVQAEQLYARDARKPVLGRSRRWNGCGGGIYDTSEQPRFVSASTVVVSFLIPLLELYPCGNDGAVWLSATVRVPSGSPVRITDLFGDPRAGLTALAAVARTRLERKYACVGQAVHDQTVGRLVARGFDPIASNYENFALTTGGLVVGFPLGQVAFPPCYRQFVTVPYRLLRPHLSRLGRLLIAGVRNPR